ncbi:MAG: HAD-IA family hydrolase [Candidatus Bathyarchaeota archaeon]|nr:MAG: HAD-IA family hydrolase [Candidatus Bathyarchaeota archaeon]
MKQIRAVLFDLDNTLIDFLRMKEEACRAAVDAMIRAGLKMDRETAYARLMEVYFAVGIESDTAFARFLETQGQFKHKTLAAAINAYLKGKNDYLKAYPHVEQTLRALKNAGVTLVLVTDAPKTKAYQRLLAMNIDSYFDSVVAYEDTNRKKREGTPLRLAMEKLKEKMPEIENDEVLMVGDSIERDLRPAEKLGLNTALAKYGQNEKKKGGADYELADMRDLLLIVQPEKQRRLYP